MIFLTRIGMIRTGTRSLTNNEKTNIPFNRYSLWVQENKMNNEKKRIKEEKHEQRKAFFMQTVNYITKLDCLKLFDLSISIVKGFSLRIEFYAKEKAEDLKK